MVTVPHENRNRHQTERFLLQQRIKPDQYNTPLRTVTQMETQPAVDSASCRLYETMVYETMTRIKAMVYQASNETMTHIKAMVYQASNETMTHIKAMVYQVSNETMTHIKAMVYQASNETMTHTKAMVYQAGTAVAR